MNHFAVNLKLTQHCKLTILQLKKERSEFGDRQIKPQVPTGE